MFSPKQTNKKVNMINMLINLMVGIFSISNHLVYTLSILQFWDFPGGAVVKNLPANAGDMGSSPGLGRSHMPWSNKACAPQLLSLRSRGHKPQLLSLHATTTEAHAPRACALQQEKLLH